MTREFLNPPKGGGKGQYAFQPGSGRKGSRFAALSLGSTNKRGQMNKTEGEYAALLEAQKLAGEIVAWWFEPFSLRLTNPPEGVGCFYSPDFMVLYPDGSTVIRDAKGSGIDNDASVVRVKCAAELYPLWKFEIVKKKSKKDGGGWSIRVV